MSASTATSTSNNGSGSSSSSDDYSYESAVRALLSPGVHQATTKEDIARSALRRTRTVSDMRYYWNKIMNHTGNANGKSNNANDASNKRKLPETAQKKDPRLPLLIHITGTKGKGSTACMCEAVLRAHGYSTGLFTSPHLMDIRERIRWNGKPVHERIFADVYWTIRRALQTGGEEDRDNQYNGQQDDEQDDNDPPPTLPGYFRMLTLMGLYTFLHHLPTPVDAIVLEVGMGGRYDATNFLDLGIGGAENFERVAHGVTLLDLDHTRILGNTLEKIAWEKGGIFSVDKLNPSGTSARPGSTEGDGSGSNSDSNSNSNVNKNSQAETTAAAAATASGRVSNIFLDSNPPEVVRTLERCASVEGRGGSVSPADADGNRLRAALEHHGLSLGLAGSHQYGNATLAVALCRAVTERDDEDSEPNADPDANEDADRNADDRVRIAIDSPTTLRALADAAWPGRCQRLLWSRPTGSGGSGTGIGAGDTSNGRRAIEFFLDGAHTPQSLEATVEWFRSKTGTITNTITSTSTGTGTTGGNADRRPLPILVFNCSHERNPVELLELLLLPPRAGDDDNATGQRPSPALSSAPARCRRYSRVYFARADSSRPSPLARASAEELLEERGIRVRPELLLPLGDASATGGAMGDGAAATARTWQETLACVWRHLTEDDDDDRAPASAPSSSSSSSAIVCNRTAREVLDDLLSAALESESGGDDSSPSTQVFVTGSLYLVGSFLAAMDWREESSPAPS